MRLLDTHTGHFVEEDLTRLRLLDTQAGYGFERIKYAILSHTWDQRQGEQTYKQLREIQKRYGTVFFQLQARSHFLIFIVVIHLP